MLSDLWLIIKHFSNGPERASGNLTLCLLPQHYFTVNFNHENQKTLELRTEDAKDCDEWVAAIAHARYHPPPVQTLGWGVSEAKPCPRVAAGSCGQGCGQGAVEPGAAGRQSRALLAPSPMVGTLVLHRRLHSDTSHPALCLLVPVPCRAANLAGWRCLSQSGAGGMPHLPSGSKAAWKGFIWNSKNGQKEVFPGSCFCAVGMLAQPTCCPGESGQGPVRHSRASHEGGCWAGSEKRGQMSVVCRRLEKYHLLQHLNESRCP